MLAEISGCTTTDCAHDKVIGNQDHHRSDYCDKQAVEIETCGALGAEQTKEVTANKRPNNPKDDVQNYARTLPIHDLASDEPGNKAKNDPADDMHADPPTGGRHTNWQERLSILNPDATVGNQEYTWNLLDEIPSQFPAASVE